VNHRTFAELLRGYPIGRPFPGCTLTKDHSEPWHLETQRRVDLYTAPGMELSRPDWGGWHLDLEAPGTIAGIEARLASEHPGVPFSIHHGPNIHGEVRWGYRLGELSGGGETRGAALVAFLQNYLDWADEAIPRPATVSWAKCGPEAPPMLQESSKDQENE